MGQEQTETLRSSFMLDGARIFLVHDEARRSFRIGTRWYWLLEFDNVWDACDAFEALEMSEPSDHKELARWMRVEIQRNPRSRSSRRGRSHGRIVDLVLSIERRLSGLRPVTCGRKSSLTKWVPA